MTTAAVALPAASVAAPPVNKWVVAASVGFGAVMGSIDMSIVNVAMPHIRGSIGATLEEITWIATAYIIASVMLMPLSGFLGALLGQKRIYLASLGIFLVGSALCGMARSLIALAGFRALQGFGAGMLQPTQQAILRQTFPPEEQGMAMALFGMAIMIGPALGPTLGGWITDTYSWPWIFYINLPIGIVGVFMVMRFVHEPPDLRAAARRRVEAQRGHLDWQGIAFVCVGVACLQYVLEEGNAKDWLESGAICACAAVAVVALVVFVIRELTATAPAVNLRLFKEPSFLAGTAIGGLQFAMLTGSMFLLPVFLQEILGYDATDSGIAMLPRMLAMLLVVPLVGRIYNKVSPALVIGVGVVLFSFSCWQMSRITTEWGTGDMVVPLLVSGVGFGCMFVPLTTTALSGIPRAQLIDATGLNSFVRQIGGSVGLSVFVSLLSRFATHARSGLSASVNVLRPQVAAQLSATRAMLEGRGYDPALARALAVKVTGGRVAGQAMVIAFEKSFLLQGIAFLAILPLLYFLRSRVQKQAVAIVE